MSNTPIRRIVLHYSATYPDQDLGVADIRRMHLQRGFNDVGYHYVIKRDGTVQKGRPDNVVGAHVSGHNTGSIGICCIGGIERATGPNVGVDNRTEAQKAATINLVKDLLAKHPGAEVVGHRDLGPTQCPGFDVRSWWAAANARPPLVDAAPPVTGKPSAPAITGQAKGGIYIIIAGAVAALAYFIGVK
ncbi:lysozyme [Paracoccus aestuarii]|uniref:Lysozyme n=1 Tax=Paracoccus aestuarii TaxID=453842 RepID=A0A418ZZK4_9RHOB|nr:N-acetylmuramoyl-L-alanine amidase [Paracoccus aestuarii]RJL06031.1 lysozyme [Paracoccus aestuarii]WCQ99119.1 N-acetylmuramoyl-L-alanine amidase [Paracoccus aestuarii]